METEETIDGLIRKGLKGSGLVWDEQRVTGDLSYYTEELEKWNRRINLTGKRTGKEIVVDLLYDAFFAYNYVKGKRSILDMGSGAGVIGIPLAILDDCLNVVSVDASRKKIQFQRHVKRVLQLRNLSLFACRIEDLEPQNVEAVIVKAFGSTDDALDKAGRHLSSEGSVILLKGKSEVEKNFPGFELQTVIPYHLMGSVKEFKLLTYKKVP